MKCPYIIGERLYFRPLKPKDLGKGYLQWLNDSDVNKFIDYCRKPISEYNLLKYYEKIMDSDNVVIFAVIEKKTDKHIGNIELNKIDRVHRQANYGRMIGDKSAWGKGYGEEMLRLLMDYAFNALNLNRIYTSVIENNIASIKSNEKAGMVNEGVLHQARFIKGKYRNIINYGMTRNHYKKLHRKRKVSS